MSSFLVPDLVQQPVGVGISRGATVEIAHLVVLSGLPGREQPLHGGKAGLKPQPEGDLHRGCVGNLEVELGHPPLQAPPVASLGVRHLAQDRSVALVHPLRDQLVHSSSEDLAPPCLHEALSCLPVQRRIALRSDLTRHGKNQPTRRGGAAIPRHLWFGRRGPHPAYPARPGASAAPRICGFVIHHDGPNGSDSTSTTRKPAAAMALVVWREQWQPPPSSGQTRDRSSRS
jgi:hypothetical protein